MSALTVLYVMFVAGAFSGCGVLLRLARLRHREEP